MLLRIRFTISILMALSWTRIGSGGRGHGNFNGGRRGQRPHSFRPRPSHVHNNPIKFVSNNGPFMNGPIIVGRPQKVPYSWRNQQPFQSKFNSNPFQSPYFQNGQGFLNVNPWGQFIAPKWGQNTSLPDPNRMTPTHVNKSPSTLPPKIMIVDEAGPVQPGPSEWEQVIPEDEVPEPTDPQGQNVDPSIMSEKGQSSGIVEEAGSVEPGPSIWTQDNSTNEEVGLIETGAPDQLPDNSSGQEDFTDDPNEKTDSSTDDPNVNEYNIYDFVDVRLNLDDSG